MFKHYIGLLILSEGVLETSAAIIISNKLLKKFTIMSQYSEIEYKVLQQIIPTDEDRKNLECIIKKIIDNVTEEINKRNLRAVTELVGSTAKDTFLRNSLDIDLFLLFPPETERQFMANHTLTIGRIILHDTEECYAEHPYIRGTYNGYKVELVPSYQIQYAHQKLSSVDRTPLHTRYVKDHISDKQKQEVRLFKQFLHGIGCYGAEASIQGFSGYLCEILILKFNTFHNLLKQATEWKTGTKLSLLDKQIPNFQEILIMIDPVDHERNVASAIAKETFELFQKASIAYIKHPSITFFFPKAVLPWSIEQIKTTTQRQPYRYVGIRFPKPDIIDENLYPQLRKACRNIETACTNYGFTIYYTNFFISNNKKYVYLIIQTDKDPISDKQTHMGPPTNYEPHQSKFLEKWENNPQVIQGPYNKNNRWYVDLRRQYTQITQFLLNILPTLSLGKHIEKILKQHSFVMENNDLFKEEFSTFWTTYLDGKQSWER